MTKNVEIPTFKQTLILKSNAIDPLLCLWQILNLWNMLKCANYFYETGHKGPPISCRVNAVIFHNLSFSRNKLWIWHFVVKQWDYTESYEFSREKK